jgi:hypothetical protein
LSVKWYAYILHKATAKKAVPTITCIPWKPVPKKKHVPKAPSLIVKEDTLYSKPWKPVNIAANKIVATEPYKAAVLLPCIKP